MSSGAATVGDLGEVALVERILAAAGAAGESAKKSGLQVGPGDDAAVLATPDKRVVVTTDMLIEGRHFRRDWSSAQDIGHKAAAENLADVAAMGARPTAVVVALGMPPETEVAWVDGFLAGLLAELARGGATLAGGDVVRSDVVTVSVTALGTLEGRGPILRSGARSGDTLAVAGDLGSAAAGLAVLSRGFRSPRALVDAHRRPMPPYSAGISAAKAGATSMIDVSDGLLLDAHRLADASGVSVDIDATALPIREEITTTAAAYNLDPLRWVLGGGDDHALLATFPEGEKLPRGFARIGVVTARSEQAVLVNGKPSEFTEGFEHFRA